ncbi:hypothetical protein H5410_001804 [Solanum commersonii]|uniref:Uncharacterized protein n=1 Tax=Solanum commersonii TaxID=4109 RepID=A0A9J6B143_SOLCO|nr:hypothetical protein H5410_001804 [Solanum commersonii]
MSLHGDFDDENLKVSIVFNATRNLKGQKLILRRTKVQSRGQFSNQDQPFKIMAIGPNHSCGNQRNNKTIGSEFLAKKYEEEFRIN